MGCTKENSAGVPSTVTESTDSSGWPLPNAVGSRSSVRLDRHCVALAVSVTWLPGRNVFVADWGTAVSKDPYVKFSFRGGNKGDDLKISWVDNQGETDATTAKIQ